MEDIDRLRFMINYDYHSTFLDPSRREKYNQVFEEVGQGIHDILTNRDYLIFPANKKDGKWTSDSSPVKELRNRYGICIMHPSEFTDDPATLFSIPGIYLMHHPSTDSVYVGESGSIRSRMYTHLRQLQQGKKPDYFQAYYAEHPTFYFRILAFCGNKQIRLLFEDYCIQRFRDYYTVINVSKPIIKLKEIEKVRDIA